MKHVGLVNIVKLISLAHVRSYSKIDHCTASGWLSLVREAMVTKVQSMNQSINVYLPYSMFSYSSIF